jgi:RNA polymerase primary sigma factor
MLPSYTTLSDTDLGDLARGGDLQAVHTLVIRYDPWAWKLARRYANQGMDLEDLHAEAVIALLESAPRFDGRMSSFTTYSAYQVIRRFTLALGRQAYPVSLSYNACLVKSKLQKARTRLRATLHAEPTSEQVGTEAGLEPRWTAWVEGVTLARVAELDGPGPALNDFASSANPHQIPDASPSSLEVLENDDLAAAVEAALGTLPKRHADILRALHGLDGWQESRTLTDVGAELGCTKENVRQIREKGVARLKAEHGELLREYHPAPVERKTRSNVLDDETRDLLAREREAYRQRQAAREAS